jgi:hypothetical protein
MFQRDQDERKGLASPWTAESDAARRIRAQLALKAIDLDPNNGSAKWLAAAAQDRLLMKLGKPQRYGTQFHWVDGQWAIWEVDPSVTDEERSRWNVPSLREAANARRL